MKRFSYHRPESLRAATAALDAAGSVALGGGTDLLVTMKEGLVSPERLVDLRRIPGARNIELRSDGSARLGGGVRIADIAADAALALRFPSLTHAAQFVGTPALRNMGTIAGNLCQRPRCWYFRRGVPCLKNGGTGCAAVAGDNQYHAVFGSGPCHAVHPSDPAVALTALDAIVEIAGPNSTSRAIALADFFNGAEVNPHGETALVHGEMIVSIEIPARSAGGVQRYEKLMQRGAWDFALVSLAGIKRNDGEVRLVLGGVAAAPWRVNASVEEDVASGALDEESADALAERALYDAEPMTRNGYKTAQAAALLKRMMLELSRS